MSDRAKKILEDMREYASLSPEERQKRSVEAEQRKVDAFNRTPGKLCDGYTNTDNNIVPGDGYNCQRCMNRGEFLNFTVDGNGIIHEYVTFCDCMKIRKSIMRMKRSGLEKSVREKTFKSFIAEEPWQQKMLEMARKYIYEGVKDGRWFYAGGQVGCGKTHICTAIAGKLLTEKPLVYVVWPQVIQKLKSVMYEEDDYAAEIGQLQEIDVLYIDDFFKPTTGEDKYGNAITSLPTATEIKIAFEILNYRYINKMPTIISSEWHMLEIADKMDEATASRIAERCGEFAIAIGRDRARNQRFKINQIV